MDHIGIDVHKRESQIYMLAEGGEVVEHGSGESLWQGEPARRSRWVGDDTTTVNASIVVSAGVHRHGGRARGTTSGRAGDGYAARRRPTTC